MPLPPPTPTPVAPGPEELDAVVAFVAAQQAAPERRCPYVGLEVEGIRAELDGLEPPWTTTVLVLRDGDRIEGAVVTEWDVELGRSWIFGPWVAGDDAAWTAGAETLLDAALAGLPPTVPRRELSGDVAHHRLADLAAARGWTASEPSHVLVADADVVAGWPAADGEVGTALRPAGPEDLDAITALHDAEFPGTYATAAQLVAGQLDGTRTVLVAEGPPGVVGYAAGEVHDDGEGYVDFLVVDPASRGHGVGRDLVVALTRRLLDVSPAGRVALSVQDHRTPARALYERLGFRPDGIIVGYGSPTSTTTGS